MMVSRFLAHHGPASVHGAGAMRSVVSRSAPVACLVVGLLAALPRGARAQHTWRVRAGDALSLIAQRFGVTVDELREWNELEDDTIFVGQELQVAPAEPRSVGSSYVVEAGDTLSAIALRFGVSIEQIGEWNPDIDPDRIRVGDEIRVGPGRRRIEHVVQAGDTASAIARRYGVALRDLREWNERIDLDRIRIGRRLVVFTDEPESRSQAVGAPYDGRLEHAVRLPPHPGYVIRDRDRAWATEETARWIVEAFDAVRTRFPRAPRVRVHDISLREGGFMHGHRSHQTGRDVDLSYYQRNCGNRACPVWRLPPEQLDVERQWALLRHWLERDQVEAIFMDYRLQAPLYRHAREQGATRAQLHRWFQYPRGRNSPLGIIRHYPQHDDHLHVRFVCPESDAECR